MSEVKMVFLEDFMVGDCIESPAYKVPKEQVMEFAKQWDPQPFHINEEQAKESLYGGLTACSAHIFSIFCWLANDSHDGAKVQAIAGLGFDEMRMHQPVFAEDTVYTRSEVIEVRRSKSKPDRGIAKSLIRMYNQRDEEVFSIQSTFMISAREH